MIELFSAWKTSSNSQTFVLAEFHKLMKVSLAWTLVSSTSRNAHALKSKKSAFLVKFYVLRISRQIHVVWIFFWISEKSQMNALPNSCSLNVEYVRHTFLWFCICYKNASLQLFWWKFIFLPPFSVVSRIKNLYEHRGCDSCLIFLSKESSTKN